MSLKLGTGLGLNNVLPLYRGPPVYSPLVEDPEMWWKFDSASSVTLDTGISTVSDRSGNSRTLTQLTDAKQPAYTDGWAVFDGVDDAMSCVSPNLGAAMTLMCIIDPQAGDSQWMTFESSGFNFVGGCFDADGNQGDTGSGIPTYYKNGVAVAKDGGGGTWTSRDALHDAFLPGSGPYVFEARGVNMTASWTNLAVSGGGYGASWLLKGRVKEVVVCPDPVDATELRNYMIGRLA